MEPTHPNLHSHFVNSMTAFGVESSKHFTGLYTFLCTSHAFLSIGGSTGQFDVYDLSCKTLQFACILWGRIVACVSGRLSPSKFLDLNISHPNSGRLCGPYIYKLYAKY